MFSKNILLLTGKLQSKLRPQILSSRPFSEIGGRKTDRPSRTSSFPFDEDGDGNRKTNSRAHPAQSESQDYDFLEKFKLGFDRGEKTRPNENRPVPEPPAPPAPEGADEIFKKMKETGLIPNAVAMLDGLCKDGLVQEAMKLFSLMREKGTIPEVVIYTAVVEGFCKAHQFDDAKRIFRKMQSNGISPNAFSYTVLVHGLYRAKRLEDALEFCMETATITETEVISHDDEDEQTPHPSQQLKGKKLSWQKLRRSDSLDIESGKLHGHHGHASKGAEWSVILHLAFQSIGIVYGDIGTSPLYVYASTFTDGIKNNDDILGVLSLIFYTLTLIPLIKYVLIVLRANDNGDGGTFALYSLICRYAKVGLIPSQEAEDRDVSTFQLELPNNRVRRASKLKSKLENSRFAKFFLLFATMLGTSMVIGDGVLTPCISVLSAVGGIKEATSAMTQDRIVWVSVGILVFLFMVQRFGTDKVGYSFAPIICVWFCFIGGIGIYNFFKYDPTVVKAINPAYIVNYFQRNKKQAWISLGGIVLAITGTEALFADVGHFTVRSIQISMCSVTYPALILAYTGQASFLRKHNDLVSDTFFKSIPKSLYWPMFVVAVAASIIASQAMISGTFSIIQQSLSMGCFPRVKIVHTSAKYEGQVYIPEVNYLLMIACVAVTVGFRTTTKIGNAYGIAVVFVMTLTSSFLVLIMIMIWKTHILLVVSYVLVIGSVELLYLSSVLYKFDQGGYLPLAFAMVLMAIMYIWNDVYRKKYYYELDHKISPEKLKEIASETNFCRMPGLAIFYSELVHGIPPIFKHYVANVPALHSVLVFVSIKSLPISKVPVEERFLFRRVDPHDLYVFRCVVRYGYTDVRNEEEPFERLLLERLKEYIRDSFAFSRICAKNDGNEREREEVEEREDGSVSGENGEGREDEMEREIEVLDRAWRGGVVHLVGEHEVIAGKGAGFGKRVLIDYAYNVLKRNLRQTNKVFDIPHKRMLKVGMTYEI